jgi:GrpB-like predicted nucleotidyltransferase (UPF0157 family)
MMQTFTVVPYSDSWPYEYELVRSELLAAIGLVHLKIEHIGSTAVPGLAAKPVLDVLLGVDKLPSIESRIPALERIGYTYRSKYESELPMRRYLVRSLPGSLRVHVHAVVEGSEFWHKQLAFRDLLRTRTEWRSRYQSLKLELASTYAHDKSAYTVAKGPFIEAALAEYAKERGKPV